MGKIGTTCLVVALGLGLTGRSAMAQPTTPSSAPDDAAPPAETGPPVSVLTHLGIAITASGLLIVGVGVGLGLDAGRKLDPDHAVGLSENEWISQHHDLNQQITRANQTVLSGAIVMALGAGLLVVDRLLHSSTESSRAAVAVAPLPDGGGGMGVLRLHW